VNTVLRQTIKLRSYDFASHGVEVLEEFDESLPAALGDAQQLQQVFLNILNNAYDAVQESGQRGQIIIRTASRNDVIEISMVDNGTGIADPDRIFDPFYTTKHVGKGTGLGLSICYGIVRAHGGEIQCWNNEGAGSTFLVRIPMAQTEAVTSLGDANDSAATTAATPNLKSATAKEVGR
ncbi:MAG: HAMP domain-containing histidine kinase, partial [Acidobacteriota bacterium]|nr:HAMP domain-containing histidine kinase [Acidobacteriota bacterium]